MQSVYDKKDAEILARLRVNSNQSMSALAEYLSIPRTTLQERISRLISSGVIKRFTIQQDYSKLGNGVTAFILISFQSSAGTSQKKASRELAQNPHNYEGHIISGDWDILVKARGESIESIGQLVMDKIRNIKGVERTLTCASFLTLKEEL